MELNRLLDKELTPEQKRKFERDNGKFKMLNILIVLPIITSILGVFMESIAVVSASIVCIIVLLLFIAFSTKKRNMVYEKIIVPLVLKERFNNFEYLAEDLDVETNFWASDLGNSYSKFEARNSFLLHEDRYKISISKIITKNKKEHNEENDDEKEFEKSFSGLFAYVYLPKPLDIDIKVKENLKSVEQVNDIDKADVQKVRMNNIEFDTQYDVIANDPSSARRVLSIGVMARILEINRKLGKVISFSIKNNELYILIDYDEFLEFSSNKNKEYVDESRAEDSINVIEVVDYFVRYIVNLAEI